MGGYRWKITLKDHLCNSAGETFTINNLIETIQESSYSFVNLKKIDDCSVLLEFEDDKTEPFLSTLSSFISFNASNSGDFPSGFGAYDIESFTPGVSVVLKANPNWYGDLPENQAKVTVFEDNESATQNEVDNSTKDEIAEPIEAEISANTSTDQNNDSTNEEQLNDNSAAESTESATTSTILISEEPEEPENIIRAEIITIYFNISPENQAAMLRNGEIDVALDLGSDNSFLEDNEGLRIRQETTGETLCLFLNMKSNSLVGRYENLRTAVFEAIDTNTIASIVGSSLSNGGVMPSSTPGYTGTNNHAVNLEDATALIKKGGYSNWDVSIWCNQTYEIAANEIARQLSEVSLKPTVHFLDGDVRDAVQVENWNIALLSIPESDDILSTCYEILGMKEDGSSTWFNLSSEVGQRDSLTGEYPINAADILTILDYASTMAGRNTNNLNVISRWTVTNEYMLGLYSSYTIWGMRADCGSGDYTDNGLLLAKLNSHQ